MAPSLTLVLGPVVLARRALPLTEVVYLAAKAGWDYLIVDGVNIPTERVGAQYSKKQYWYSGKHSTFAVYAAASAHACWT